MSLNMRLLLLLVISLSSASCVTPSYVFTEDVNIRMSDDVQGMFKRASGQHPESIIRIDAKSYSGRDVEYLSVYLENGATNYVRVSACGTMAKKGIGGGFGVPER